MKLQLKTNYSVEDIIESFYLGGQVIYHDEILFTTNSDSVVISTLISTASNTSSTANKFSIASGNDESADIVSAITTKTISSNKSTSAGPNGLAKSKTKIKPLKLNQETQITCISLSPDGITLIITLQNLLLKVYSTSKLFQTEELEGDTSKEPILLRKFKVHEASVLVMTWDTTSTLLATGSADSTVKVWDITKGHATHNFKGHSGIISSLALSPSLILASASSDTTVRLWDLKKKSCICIFKSHVSIVRGLVFTPDMKLWSVGRDKVLLKWTTAGIVEETIPVHERLEAIVRSKINGREVIATAGENGVVRYWDLEDGSVVDGQTGTSCSYLDIEGHNACGGEVNGLVKRGGGYDDIVALTTDQNIIFFNEGARTRQLVGYNQEILDLLLIAPKRLLCLTNTAQLKVYDLDTNDCAIVAGHEDIVLTCAGMEGRCITGSKDRTAVLWDVEEDGTMTKTAVLVGHTGPVTAVAIRGELVLTAAQDRTIKAWDCNGVAKYTFQAHENDIHGLDIAPNGMFVSCSLDKTAKIWNGGKLVGTLKGHKRGVWKARFSDVDQCVVTCSSDKTIKVWSVASFACIRTFEGHLNTVLNVAWMSTGMQILSCGSDGLVKLWDVKEGECVGTFDNHEDRIWALAVSPNEDRVYTGSSDSTITVWRDVSVEEEEERERVSDEKMNKELDLGVFMKRKDYKSAVILAMQLEQPFKVLSIFTLVLKQKNGELKGSGLDDYLGGLADGELEKFMFYIRDWNTHSKHSRVAQKVLAVIMETTTPQTLIDMPKARELFESLISYSERHLGHANQLIKDHYLVDYTLERMDAIL